MENFPNELEDFLREWYFPKVIPGFIGFKNSVLMGGGVHRLEEWSMPF